MTTAPDATPTTDAARYRSTVGLADAIWQAVATDAEPGTPQAYADWRVGYDRFGDGLPRPRATRIEAIGAPVPAERVTVGDITPSRLVLHVHGGGYVLGSPVSHRNYAAYLAERSGAAVVLPDYRLSPEAAYPAAVDDVVVIYRWLIEEQGWDPADVVFGGDSAGSGVATAALFRIRDAGLPLPAAAALLSPWADMCRPGEGTRVTNGNDPMYSADFFVLMTAAVVGDGDPADPLVSPVYGDYSGLPPLLVHVGRGEALRDDGEAIAAAAAAAGVEATLRVWDAGHNFQVFPGFFADDPDALAWRALDDLAAFVLRSTTR